MANEHRGETPFVALGREMYVVYRTPELAAMRSALGFGRPDPLAAPRVEEIEVEEEREVEAGKWEKFAVKKRQVIGFAERQARLLAAFEATFMSPGPDDLMVMLREGLRPWEQVAGVKLSDEEFRRMVGELGFAGAQNLHLRAVGAALGVGQDEKPKTSEEGDPNGASAAGASSTSSTS